MTPFEDRIAANDYTTNVYLQETEAGLELSADVGDQFTTVVLDANGVRNLRLALTRYERAVARAEGSARG